MYRILMFLVKLLQIFLHNTLDIGINGTVYRVTVHGRFDGPLQVGIIIQISILSSGGSVQHIIVILFQSVLSFVVRSGESDHIRRQGTVGIDSLVFFLEPDALDLAVLQCCRLKTADLIIGQPSERDIPGRIRMTDHILSHCRHIQIREICGQRLHRRFQISLTA